jgi:hypothetical protein
MQIWQTVFAEKAMPFGDHLLLNKQLRFCAILSLKSNAIWQSFITE